MYNQEKKSIETAVFEKIEKKDVVMKPRSYFILKSILYILGTLLVLIFSVFLTSFIFFVLRLNGSSLLPGFGFAGMRIFFASFPWFLLFTAILFIGVFELFVKKFSFSYRKPILYSVLGAIILVFTLGFIMAPFHGKIFNQAEKGKLPLAGFLYRGYGNLKFNGAYIGKVFEILPNGFQIKTKDNNDFFVAVSSITRFPFNGKIEKGDIVIVIGKLEGEAIKAFGVRKAEGRDGPQRLFQHQCE